MTTIAQHSAPGKKNCLVFALSPLQIVSAISAILTRNAPEAVNVSILVQWPSLVDSLSNELTTVMSAMVRNFPFVRQVRNVPLKEYSELLAANDEASFRSAFKAMLGIDHADEIYFPHDMGSQLYQGLATVYDNARRISIGDGLGIVCERSVRQSYAPKAENSSSKTEEIPSVAKQFRRWLGRARRKAISIFSTPENTGTRGVILQDFLPDEAVLILPVDESGSFLKQLPLTVCPKQVVLEVLRQCTDSCSELQAYISSLMHDFKGQRTYVLLTENYAEAKLNDFEREVEMYCSIIRDHCEPESVVFLKSHPGETLPRNERISERLAGRYRIVELDKKFRRYPIELWEGLILKSGVISMAYPGLSLKYLYAVDVIQPMSGKFIEQWFPQRTWFFLKNCLPLYMESQKMLPQWDGKSVLWAHSWRAVNDQYE